VFSERSLPDSVAAVRGAHAPGALVLDTDRDFETLAPAVAEDLLLLTDAVTPLDYERAWLPADAPDLLGRLVGPDLTVGMPGDGSVAWTRQTDPPVVLVKPRTEGSPDAFVSFLIAEALVEAGSDLPEHFLGFFRERYPDFDAALDVDPGGTYQVAHACYEAFLGLHTRETFRDWAETNADLHEAWADAGARLRPRADGLPGEVARGETAFADAAELACSAVKHDLDLPAPFAALDTAAYRAHGAEFAVEWAQRL
jgi:hypothetical protein